MGTTQVLNIGGYNTYAKLLQATLEELVRITVGEDNGPAGRPPAASVAAVTLPRPRAYELEWFCLRLWRRQGMAALSNVSALGHHAHALQFVRPAQSGTSGSLLLCCRLWSTRLL